MLNEIDLFSCASHTYTLFLLPPRVDLYSPHSGFDLPTNKGLAHNLRTLPPITYLAPRPQSTAETISYLLKNGIGRLRSGIPEKNQGNRSDLDWSLFHYEMTYSAAEFSLG